MTTIQRGDVRQNRLVLIVLTTALAIATALAVYFAATRISVTAGDSDSGPVSPPSVGQQDEPCWRPNVPC